MPVLNNVGKAIASGGFDVMPATNLMGKIGNAALHVGGGATVGGAATALIDPSDTGTGAAIGGVFGALSPVIGKAVEAGIRKFSNIPDVEARVTASTKEAIQNMADDLGINVKHPLKYFQLDSFQ